MKKAMGHSIAALGILCLVFCLGLFIGRRTNIITPQTNESTTQGRIIEPSGEASTRININTADAETLQRLPGIGEVLAKRIVAYRTEHGPFSSIQDLELVDGIGSGKLMVIIELICVEDTQ